MTIFTEISILTKLQKPLTQLQGVLAMKFSTNMLSQLLLTVAQIINIVSPILPENKKVLLLGLLSAIQAGVSAIAHYSTPDGQLTTSTGVIKNV